MIRHVWRDESGMALGLAVIVVVLVGVMAAGFLAVVRSDLESTVSMNRGQRAFDLADAGAQAAATQLRSDPNPEHYDDDPDENSEWSYLSRDGGTPGKTLALDGDAANVTIRYLLPATKDGQEQEEHHAPEPVPDGLADYPDGDYFLVVSEGTVGGTKRKVEVILRTTAAGGSGGVGQWSWREVYE